VQGKEGGPKEYDDEVDLLFSSTRLRQDEVLVLRQRVRCGSLLLLS
jgi:hypothetical protein